jgi:hypothetical protein
VGNLMMSYLDQLEWVKLARLTTCWFCILRYIGLTRVPRAICDIHVLDMGPIFLLFRWTREHILAYQTTEKHTIRQQRA